MPRVAEAGIKRDRGRSAWVKLSNATSGGGGGHQEDTWMWQTWEAFPPRCYHVMWVALLSVALSVSACTVPGRSSSHPAVLSPTTPTRGNVEPVGSGIDDASDNM